MYAQGGIFVMEGNLMKRAKHVVLDVTLTVSMVRGEGDFRRRVVMEKEKLYICKQAQECGDYECDYFHPHLYRNHCDSRCADFDGDTTCTPYSATKHAKEILDDCSGSRS